MDFDNASCEAQHIIASEEAQAYYRATFPLVRGEASAWLVKVQKKYRERKRYDGPFCEDRP